VPLYLGHSRTDPEDCCQEVGPVIGTVILKIGPSPWTIAKNAVLPFTDSSAEWVIVGCLLLFFRHGRAVGLRSSRSLSGTGDPCPTRYFRV
jgi:hypothetical protein